MLGFNTRLCHGEIDPTIPSDKRGSQESLQKLPGFHHLVQHVANRHLAQHVSTAKNEGKSPLVM